MDKLVQHMAQMGRNKKIISYNFKVLVIWVAVPKDGENNAAINSGRNPVELCVAYHSRVKIDITRHVM